MSIVATRTTTPPGNFQLSALSRLQRVARINTQNITLTSRTLNSRRSGSRYFCVVKTTRNTMTFRPRLLSHLARLLLGRSFFRYVPPSAPGATTDGRSSAARVFEPTSTAHHSHPYWAQQSVYILAWLLGFAAAIAYLIWFFQQVFDHTIR